MKMRTRTTILTGALLLVFSGAARAQQEPATQAQTAPTAAAVPAATTPFTPKLGTIDFGYRGENVSGDAARYQRYRDTRDGAYLDRFRFAKATDTWAFAAYATNVGYRDQRYTVSYQDIGRLKINGEWNQVPLYISDSTSWLYTDNGNGVLAIDDSIQRTLQSSGTPTSATAYKALNGFLAGASQYDLRSRRDIGTLNLVYSFNRDVDFTFDVKNAARSGYNLMSFGFGTSPGLVPVVEFGVPTDDRTTDVKSFVEFAGDRGLLNIGYTASWFVNNIPTVTFDNPFRADDISGGPSKGLVPMWASNESRSFDVNGSYKLPGRSRATAFISIAQWDQNAPLVAPTVNTALLAVMPALERPTAEAKANILSMVYSFTSRPSDFLWLNARYRYYDYANKTPIYDTVALIGDWAAGTALWENEPASVKRHTLDLDASVSSVKYLDVGVGYTRDDFDRTFRIYEKTAEDAFRVEIDSTGSQYATLRAKYEHSARRGSGFEAHLLEEVGEQPGTRHYDIADRRRDRVTTTLTLTPVRFLDVNTSYAWGKDDFNATEFGLTKTDTRSWDVGFTVIPVDRVNLGLNYGEEKYTGQQYSRTANPAPDPTFIDPTRDWWMDQNDTVKTFSATADFLRIVPKTDVRVGYDLSDGSAFYLYNMKPEQKVFTTVPLAQLSPLKNRLINSRCDVQYYVRPNLALGGAYWYENYDVTDFALSSSTLNSLAPANGTGVFASAIYSGYLYRNYKAHTGFLRMTYLW
jgi:MtrB/PioB family decaheme-associated outer membrane protein